MRTSVEHRPAPIPLYAALGRPSFWRGLLRIADPKITLASVASIVLGGALAGHDGPISWPWLAVTILAIFFIEFAKNASGELFDFDSGTDCAVAEQDRSPFSGGKRVLVDALLSRGETKIIAMVFYALAIGAGLAICALREPAVVGLGVAGIALAYFYHAPPLKLSYRGFGELAVAITYGPLVSAGTYLVQRHEVPAHVVIASLPLALMIGAFLWINEFPDLRADQSAHKRTLVVRLGAARASLVFPVIIGAAFLFQAVLPLTGLPPGLLFGLVGLPHGIAAARRLIAAPEHTARIIPAQAWTLLSFLLLALGSAAGLLLPGAS